MTNNLPLISIVIPTYNHAKFLETAVKSVVAQTYQNWEVFIVNNFSEDNTIQIVEEFKDERIKLINFRNDGVIAASRNVGIRHSSGEYVAFLDSDDVWMPEKLSNCITELTESADIVCHGELWTGTNVQPRVVMYGPPKNATYKKLLYRGNCISTSATVVRKSILEQLNGFDERPEFITAEDYDLWMRIAEISSKIAFIPEVLGEFHRHGENASGSVIRNTTAEIAVINNHFLRQKNSILGAFRRRHRLARAFYGAARALDSAGTLESSMKYFAKSFAKSPFVFRICPAIVIAVAHGFRNRARPKHV